MSSSSITYKTQSGQLVDAKDRSLKTAQELSDTYGGVTFDRNQIEEIYQKSADDNAAMRAKEYARTASQYYNRLGALQNSVIDANRKAQGTALVSGATKGMTSANNLSAVLGLQQQSSADATTLAQGDRALVDSYAAAKSKATQDALTYANQQKLALGTLGSNVYATDAQKYVGELGANAQIGTATIAADAQADTAARQLEGTKYAADMNYKGAVDTANISAASSKYAADQSLAAQKLSADAMVKSAETSAAAQRYAASAGLAAQNLANIANLGVAALENNPNNVGSAVSHYIYATNDPDGYVTNNTSSASR